MSSSNRPPLPDWYEKRARQRQVNPATGETQREHLAERMRSLRRWMITGSVVFSFLGKPETIKGGADRLGQGNIWLVQDLMAAIEQDRQPISGMYAGRAALEMILGVYESHRFNRPVELPLKNRQHPLARMKDEG